MFAVHRPFPGDHDPEIAERLEIPPYLPDTEASRVDMARFYEYIRRTDEEIGRVLDVLADNDLGEETLVVVTTDHGAPIPRGKKTLYDPGIEIAMTMRWPGVIEPGTRHNALLSNVDFTPSLLDLVGVDVPGGLHGRSFAGLLTDGEFEPREVVFAENTYAVTYNPIRAIRTNEHKYIRHFEPSSPIVMEPHPIKQYGHEITEEWFGAPIPEEQLFDLREDPAELANVATNPRYGGVRQELHEELAATLRETDDPLLDGPVPDPAGPETPRDTFDSLWACDEDGRYRLDMPESWKNVDVGI
jgi:arylsulfatase A-like enzyme